MGIHPELHKKFEEVVEDQSNGKELLGTAANSTKVLTSGKVLGKPITNTAKQEWIQRRQNKYQKDKRGHMIEATKSQAVDKLNEKNNDEIVVTRKKFDSLEVEEIENPTLMITDGKGDEKSI